MCMKQPSSPSPEPPLIRRDKRSAVAGDNRGSGSVHGNTSTAPAENESVHALLKEIRDLLKTRVHSEEEQRYEDDKENEMKNDWMLAAAVLDRICAIAVTVFFVAGSLVVFVLFVKHP